MLYLINYPARSSLDHLKHAKSYSQLYYLLDEFRVPVDINYLLV